MRIKEKYVKIIEKMIMLFLLSALVASSITFVNATSTQISSNFPVNANQINPEIDVSSMNIAIQKITITNEISANSNIKISYIKERPIDKFLIARSAYQYFSVEKTTKQEQNTILLDFRITEDWLKAQNIPLEGITLYRFNLAENRWEPLETKFKYSNLGYINYQATSNNYGYYVISDRDIILPKEQLEKTKNVEESENSTQNIITNQKEEPQLVYPLESSTNVYILPILVVLILIMSIIPMGYGVKKIEKNKKEKKVKEESKKKKTLDFLESIEKKVMQREERAKKIKEEIIKIEPKIAERFAQVMKQQGYSAQAIKNTLLQNQIDEEIVNELTI